MAHAIGCSNTFVWSSVLVQEIVFDKSVQIYTSGSIMPGDVMQPLFMKVKSNIVKLTAFFN